MGTFKGFSIIKVDGFDVFVVASGLRLNDARRKLEQLTGTGEGYRIQEDWKGEPSATIHLPESQKKGKRR